MCTAQVERFYFGSKKASSAGSLKGTVLGRQGWGDSGDFFSSAGTCHLSSNSGS